MPNRSFQVMGADPHDPRAVANAKAFNDATYAQELQKQYERNAGWRRTKNIFKTIGLGVPAGAALLPGGALSSILSSSAPAAASSSAGAGWSMPGVTAPTFGAPATTAAVTTGAKVGSLARLGSILNSDGMNLGVNAGLSLLGLRSSNKANDRARADSLAAQREALALQRQQLELEARNADLDREDARAVNAAINELKKRELDAAEEARAFDRSLVEGREARLAPYRAVSARALKRLSAVLGV